MDTILSNKIEQLLLTEPFTKRVIMDNNGIINLNYKYTCISLEEFESLVVGIKNNYVEQGLSISDRVIRAKLTHYLEQRCVPYFNEVQKSIQILDEHPYIEQKSQEWLRFRKQIITGTETEKLLMKTESDEKNNKKLFDIAKSKIDLSTVLQLPNHISKSFSSAAMSHGNTYEDVSLEIYSSRYQVKVKEYGIIKSQRNTIIGASPDGVVIEANPEVYDSFRRRGRLVEVKNPYSRIIDDKIIPKYQLQMLQQQFSCQLPICDFLETTFVDLECNTYQIPPYSNINEMLNDKLDTTQPNWKSIIKNKNIPYENLNSMGNEKGYLIRFKRYRDSSNKDEEFKTEQYPLVAEYSREAIIKWKREMISKMACEGFHNYSLKIWRLDVLDVKEFIYDSNKYQNTIIPELESHWTKIVSYKQDIIDLLLKKKDEMSLKNNVFGDRDKDNLISYLTGLSYDDYHQTVDSQTLHNETYLTQNELLSNTRCRIKSEIDIDINNFL